MKKLTLSFAVLLTSTVVLAGCMRPAPAPEPAPTPTNEPPATTPAPETAQQATLHDRVHDALQRATNLDASDISVRVEGNDVYLSGTVPTAREHALAHDVAHSVEGVDRVFHEDLAY